MPAPSTGSPLAAPSPATARARGSLSAGAGPDAIATAMPTATSSGQRGIEASGPLPRLGERPANVNGLDRPPRPPMARGGLAASTGPARPGPPPRRAHPPAPDRREGGEARRRPAPPFCQVASRASAEFRAPGGHNRPVRAERVGNCRPAETRPSAAPTPPRARDHPHFGPLTPAGALHIPRLGRASRARDPPKVGGGGRNRGKRRVHTRGSAAIPRPIPA